MERILFLDIDGVVNSDEYFIHCRNRGGDTLFIDPEKVKLLNALKDIPNISIVISSSWGTSADTPLKNLGLEIPISGHTEHFYNDFMCRGNEIEKYLNDHFDVCTKFTTLHKLNTLCKYVIVDDNDDMLLGQKKNFVKTNARKGLTDKDIEKVKQILL